MNDPIDTELEGLRIATIHLMTESMQRIQQDPRVQKLDSDKLVFALAMTAFTKILDATLDFHHVHGDERIYFLMELTKQVARLDGIDIQTMIGEPASEDSDGATERLH